MQTFEHAGYTLTWDEHSSGEHVFLFLHGWSAMRQAWLPHLAFFSPFGSCVTLDLPGHATARCPRDFVQITQEKLIDLETAAVQQLCSGRSVTLVGHSMGGMVALGVAARLPHLVKRVICVNGVVWGQLMGLLGRMQWALRHRLYPLFWALWHFTQLSEQTQMVGVAQYVHQKQSIWQNELAWRICRETYPYYRQQSLANLALLLQLLETCDLRSQALTLQMPVLAMTGANDTIVSPNQAAWLADRLPQAELAVIAETGHLPQIEAPGTFEQVVKNWLKKHTLLAET